MVSTDFYLNYALPGAIMLVYGLLLTCSGTKRMPLLIIAGLLTGWLHEAFGLAALTGSAVWLILAKGERHRAALALVAVGIGCALSALAPSTLNRLGQYDTEVTIHHTLHALLASVSIYISILLTIIALWLRKIDRRLLRPLLFWAICAAAGFAISWHLRGTGRMYWTMDTALYAYSAILAARLTLNCRQLRGLALTITVLYAAWGIGLTVQSARAAKVQRLVIDRLEAGDTVIYVPRHAPQPRWVRGMTPTYDENPREANYLGLRYMPGGWNRKPQLLADTTRAE